jgi:hypothetical protein
MRALRLALLIVALPFAAAFLLIAYAVTIIPKENRR